MEEKKKPNQFDLTAMELMTRQIEATVHLTEFLYNLLLQYKQAGLNIFGIAYLIDLMCTYLMKIYGGDQTIISDIQKQAQKEVQEVCKDKPLTNEIDKVTEQLKDMGINFKVVYDPKTKKTYPNVDLKQLNLSKEQIEEWMLNHMDEVLDEYLKKKKEREDKEKKEDEKTNDQK